uniref:60S ribosomal protein L4-like n=1 Tax=Nelumbo nucifera TaxID=4432 RepID=A0A822YFF6_NELNU|nr:TPA_asm: hypothetical protein HUJ06_031437 [Nelumbo nucifera]
MFWSKENGHRRYLLQAAVTILKENGRRRYLLQTVVAVSLPDVMKARADHQTSAKSWGTGRAVTRIPRVLGGGTHRAGQGAFGNMCHGGHMFAPTKIWRQWHRKINVNQKRFVVVSTFAASAMPSLVLARGHRIENVPEIPLVVSDSAEGIEKTFTAIKILKQVGAYPDAVKAKDSHAIRPGKGSSLIVYGTEGSKIVKAFRNIPGVEVVNVERLNLRNPLFYNLYTWFRSLLDDSFTARISDFGLAKLLKAN